MTSLILSKSIFRLNLTFWTQIVTVQTVMISSGPEGQDNVRTVSQTNLLSAILVYSCRSDFSFDINVVFLWKFTQNI